MINGEGIRENTSRTTSPDPFEEFSQWVDQKSEANNASPTSSEYSSCGESEFERYSSANSVMGTPSLCSSVGTCNDFLDLDLGSLKSLKFGDDRVSENPGFRGRLGRNSGARSVATLGGFDYLPDDRVEVHDKDVDVANGVSTEERKMSLRINNWAKSLPNSEENTSSFGIICSKNGDYGSVASVCGNGLEPPQSSDIKTSSRMSTYDDDNSEDLMLPRIQRGSDLLPTFSEKQNSQVMGTENSEDHSIRTGTGVHYLLRSSDPQLGTSLGEDKFNEHVHHDLDYLNLTSESCDPFDVKKSGSPEEEETSSRCEYSDDDGSMFNYGSDDEKKMDSYDTRNLQYRQESKGKNENPLLISSAVAFGSDDWDDFMQETEENSLVSVLFDKPKGKQQEQETEGKPMNSFSVAPVGARKIGGSEEAEIVRDIPVATCQAISTDEFKENPESYSIRDSLEQEKDLFAENSSLKIDSNIIDGVAVRELQCISNEKVIGPGEGDASENEFLGKTKLQSDPLFDFTAIQVCSPATKEPRGKEAVLSEDHEVHVLPSAVENDFDICVKTLSNYSPTSLDRGKDHPAPIEVGKFELKESYDEVVLEMEEILLDSMETHGTRFSQSNRSPQPIRDGSSTASTSGTDDVYPLVLHPLKIDGIEVVGAKQKKGDVSLGERLVGVKEYTVYLLRVWSGKDQWEVERRYRDFFTLYRQLKTLYASHGWSLPNPWIRVERESRKFFGNASPNVVSERSALIQECLRSVLHSGSPNSVTGTLIWFLSPQKAICSSSLSNTLVPQSTSAFTGGACTEDIPTLGKTISLLVEIQPRKSVKQLLEAQHYMCAGCHKPLDAEKTLMREFVLTLGWGKPRLCEYTGQLFCSSCHTNETAVLPARVLHFWDFTEYPISQMAKSYLDSIYDQPMLCVSAVNPFLFSKVPALRHVMGIRKKIGAMVPYVRCPFRRAIQRGVGSRRYLLETNEFFALRDLVDLSKGAFAALPVMVETLSTKILEHISQQCLVCCDVGIPCGAKQACEDPSSLIFPFQDDEVKRCSSCESVFHKPCFRNLSQCPCGVRFEVGKGVGPALQVKHGSLNERDYEALNALTNKPGSGSTVGFISNLFTKKRQEKVWGRTNSNPVIHMGSLPSTFSDPL